MLRGRASKRRGHDGHAVAANPSSPSSTFGAANDDHRGMEPGRSATYPSAPPSSSEAVVPAAAMKRSGRRSSCGWGPKKSRGLPTVLAPMLQLQVLLLLLFLSSFGPLAFGQQCENALEIYVYDSESQCTSRETPSAVGQLFADSTCRATTVLSYQSNDATYLLPGRYMASCVPPTSSTSSTYPLGQVNFAMSGCTSTSCSSSSGADICDRDGAATSTYYSRLDPPEYMVQSSANSNFVCLQLRSGDSTFWFAIFGDCTETSCGGGSDATDSPTDAPPDATESPTDAPPEPTSAPKKSREPSAAPVAEKSPTPQPAPGETPGPTPDVQATPSPAAASPTSPSAPSPKASGSPQNAPTPSPILLPPSQQSQTPASSNESSSGMNVGVLVGAVLGAMIALSVVLVAGFYAGSLRQKNKQNSTGNVSPNNGDGGSGSGKGGEIDPDGNQATWIPATLATGFATSKEIVVDSNYGDDVSTLGTPWGVMSTGPGGATVVIEDGTVAQNSVAWDYKNKPEPSLAEDSNTFASGPTAILSGALAGHRGGGGGNTNTNKGRTILADDSSFEKAYDDDEKDYYCDDTELDNGTPGGANSSSLGLRFTVKVPPGKLGMVIDNAPGTVPEVRALKPDSVLVSRGVLVGDYLEQVDGMDVRDWTCLQVSQMIQKKSGQKSRELAFYRRPRNSSSGAVFTIDEL